MNIKENVKKSIIALAKDCDINKVVLFGSRARMDNHERSDIDLAVSGGNTALFAAMVEEVVPTLLFFDVVDVDHYVQRDLLEDIQRDGVVLYEKSRKF